MQTVEQLFVQDFQQYVIDNSLVYASNGSKQVLDTLTNHKITKKSVSYPQIKNVNVFEDDKIYVQTDIMIHFIDHALLSDNIQYNEYIYDNIDRCSTSMAVLKSLKNDKSILKMLSYKHKDSKSTIEETHLEIVLEKLKTIDCEGNLHAFVNNRKIAFKKSTLQALLMNFLEEKNYDLNLYQKKIKTEESLFSTENTHTYTINIDKATLYKEVVLSTTLDKENYWTMLKNSVKFLKSSTGKKYGFKNAIIDNYSNSYDEFKIIIECNENNILDKKSLEKIVLLMFKNFKTGIDNNKMNENLTEQHKADYSKICYGIILDKKIPNNNNSSSKKIKI